MVRQYRQSTGAIFSLQVPYGSYAAGSLDSRPSEARLEENKMTDEMPMNAQNIIGSFLINKRFEDISDEK